mmetsp:Transcript_100671/g.285280  ORF Transcript_100671/g.285280 Transcript_100671/m.285280 type:complete len:303 (+) Transcript_100671:81-989(+)
MCYRQALQRGAGALFVVASFVCFASRVYAERPAVSTVYREPSSDDGRILEEEIWKGHSHAAQLYGKKFDKTACVFQGGWCTPIEPLRQSEWRNVEKHGDLYGFPEEEWVIYKADIIDTTVFPRLFYIDMGANTYESSVGGWFLKRYPRSRSFKVIAFETEHEYDGSFSTHPEVELLHFAVWITNTTLPWAKKNIDVHCWAKKKDPINTATRPAIDIADFLGRRVKQDNFVVVKCDIEGAEYHVLPHLISQKATSLIDELFVEVHTNINSMFKGANAQGHYRPDALKLIQGLRDAGVYAHEWA